jgi:hypothetical protein
LAPTVGTLGVGIMNSMAFSLSANSNPQVNKIQIPFGTIDFQPHQSSFAQVFESMDQDMGFDDRKSKLSRRITRFDLPFKSDETGSIGK